MAMVGFTEAAKLAGVSRQHLYKMADTGQISVIKELLPGKVGDSPKDYRQFIDASELKRVFGQLSVEEFSENSISLRPELLEVELNAARHLLREREEQLRQAQEREEWLKKQVDETQGVVKLLGHSKQTEAEDVVSAEKFNQAMKKGQQQIDKLVNELDRTKSRGFFARIFNK